MKKLRIGLATIAAVFLLSLVASINVSAAGPPDQYCDASSSSGWTTIIRTAPNLAKQTFKPDQNRLSRVVLDMEGDGNGTVALTVWGGGSLYGSTNGTNGFVAEPSGRGDVEFYFNDEILTPGETYTLLPVYSDGNAKLGWYYKSDCYADGDGYISTTPAGWDFGFETYGFTYTEPDPLPETTPEDTSEDTTSTDTNTTSDTATTISADIAAPVLTSVVKNNLQIIDFTDGVTVNGDDLLVLNGTAIADSTVVVTLNDKTYQATVSQSGIWILQLKIDELASGEYTVTAKTQVGNEVSEEATLVTINLTAVEAAETIAAVEESDNGWLLYLYIGLGVLVVAGGGLAYYLTRRKKKTAKKSTEASSVTTPEDSTTNSEEKSSAKASTSDTTPPTDTKDK